LVAYREYSHWLVFYWSPTKNILIGLSSIGRRQDKIKQAQKEERHHKALQKASVHNMALQTRKDAIKDKGAPADTMMDDDTVRKDDVIVPCGEVSLSLQIPSPAVDQSQIPSPAVDQSQKRLTRDLRRRATKAKKEALHRSFSAKGLDGT
jgi:hypothetical protein